MPAQGLMAKATGSGVAGGTSEARSSWYTGALGEFTVAGVLAGLGEGWTVLHSVPVGNADCDIDHVVIGPPGVFAINSKHHASASIWTGGWGLFVNGSKTGYIPKAVAEAQRAEKLLSEATGLTVPVVAIIAVVGADKFSGEAPPAEGVLVMPHTDLLKLRDRRREFSDEQVQCIAAAASRSSTWRATPLAPDGDRDRLAAFSRS
ncbi:nuclease-related domain-containing protein [Marisediminicola sp. LYQ85]|uniref:nuclease-related domain-containing protein n=1 Tax=Marisediminicola sp. LYQ85 TaxID=3391062 RepID=UPI003983CC58